MPVCVGVVLFVSKKRPGAAISPYADIKKARIGDDQGRSVAMPG